MPKFSICFHKKKSVQMVVALDIMGCVKLNKLYSGKRSKLLRKLTYLISLATADYFWCTEDHITSLKIDLWTSERMIIYWNVH